MAACNGDEWIEQQIRTILGQNAVDVHIVISDDLSADRTLDVISVFHSTGRVSVISPELPTGSAAQNFLFLIRETDAKNYSFIAFSDQDDIWLPDKLTRACAILIERGADIYSCATTAFWINGRERLLAQAASATESDFFFEGAGQGCTYVLTKAFYDKARAFILQNGELTERLHYHDWMFYALSRSWRLKWTYDSCPMLLYRQHEKNDTGAKTTLKGIRRRLTRIRSGWYAEQVREIARVCAKAAPCDARIVSWCRIISQPRSVARWLGILKICIAGGRRRHSDYLMLFVASASGWL